MRAGPVEQRDRGGDAVGREADLRAGEVEADDAGVAVARRPARPPPPSGRPAAWRTAARPTRIGVPAAAARLPAAKPSTIASTAASIGQPAGRRQLRREAHLGVHDAVGGEVQRALARHPVDRVGGLHHADGVRERLEVAHQRAGVGRLPEPRAELGRIGGGQVAVPVRVGQLDHRLRPQPAVEVVVQQDLRCAPDGSASSGVAPPLPAPCPASGRNGCTAPGRRCTRGRAPARPAPAPSPRPARRRPASRAGTPSAGPAPST